MSKRFFISGICLEIVNLKYSDHNKLVDYIVKNRSSHKQATCMIARAAKSCNTYKNYNKSLSLLYRNIFDLFEWMSWKSKVLIHLILVYVVYNILEIWYFYVYDHRNVYDRL